MVGGRLRLIGVTNSLFLAAEYTWPSPRQDIDLGRDDEIDLSGLQCIACAATGLPELEGYSRRLAAVDCAR
jgi:hypothetical protein